MCASEPCGRPCLSFRSPLDHFHDILQAINLIQEFVGTLSFEAYEADFKTRSAVERQFQILSEAAYRLGSEAEALCPGPDWTGLRGMGNVLRHAYHRVNDEAIWKAANLELPSLREAITRTLAVLESK
jgi:uncharacterized protein with HEPN domain